MPIVECFNCGKEVAYSDEKAERASNEGWNYYCSLACQYATRTTIKTLECSVCGKTFQRKPSQLARSKSGRPYCSSSCAATASNTGRVKRAKRYCLNCNSELKYSAFKYCSSQCQDERQYKIYIQEWKEGKQTGLKLDNMVSGYVKRYIWEKYERKCCMCGWNKINPTTGRSPLEIDHIDGNWQNNAEDNLRLLCPNCHSLTPTFKALNHGNGRSGRYK